MRRDAPAERGFKRRPAPVGARRRYAHPAAFGHRGLGELSGRAARRPAYKIDPATDGPADPPEDGT